MNTKKQALVAILLVLWISGLWSQLHSWKTTTLYLLLTLLMITAGGLTGRFKPNRLGFLDDEIECRPRINRLGADVYARLPASTSRLVARTRFAVPLSCVKRPRDQRHAFSYPRWLFAICFSPRNPELFLPSSDLIPFFNKVLLISSTFFHASSFRITSRA